MNTVSQYAIEDHSPEWEELDDGDIRELCLSFLRGRKSTLWGQFFALGEGGRDSDEAAEWLAGIIRQVLGPNIRRG